MPQVISTLDSLCPTPNANVWNERLHDPGAVDVTMEVCLKIGRMDMARRQVSRCLRVIATGSCSHGRLISGVLAYGKALGKCDERDRLWERLEQILRKSDCSSGGEEGATESKPGK